MRKLRFREINNLPEITQGAGQGPASAPKLVFKFHVLNALQSCLHHQTQSLLFWGKNSLRHLSALVCMHQSLSRVLLSVTPWTVAFQASLSMNFSRKEYWNGQQFPSPRNLLDQRIKPESPALQADSLPSEPAGKPCVSVCTHKYVFYVYIYICVRDVFL